MRRSGTGSGGGYGSRNVRHVTAPKREPRAYARNPGAVAQYGQMQGTHITHDKESSYRGDPDFTRKGYNAPVGPTNLAVSGPGAGREVMKSGQQSCHGTPDRGERGLPSHPLQILYTNSKKIINRVSNLS